ncbi:MAG: hypothetical protein Q7T40_04335 [Methylobacter sp.]|nr:hypothetical protein [Methylobacter sp.]
MKLKFKKQAYQTNAVEAVANCFAGQPPINGVKYRVDPGRSKTGEQQTSLDDSGFRNNDVVLTSAQLLENIHAVQRHQNLPLSTAQVNDKKTGCPINLDIEVETAPARLIAISKRCLS